MPTLEVSAASAADTYRFWSKVRIGDSCWEWVAGRSPNGYGKFDLASRTRGAHRLAYELTIGPVPDGHQVHHVCENRACVRPDHLEVKTPGDHVRHHASQITHCPHGHAYDATNTFTRRGQRVCRTCHRAAALRYYHGRRADADPGARRGGARD